MSNPPVAVLMSTYNGEKYLIEQINSILNQSYENIHLFIRDDGSTDDTRSILNQFMDNPKITVILGTKNLGYKNSFLSLLKTIVNTYDEYQYFSFSDQDDIWMKEKISMSIRHLETNNNPYRVYFSGLTFVDSDKQQLKVKDESRVVTTFPAEMVRHSISGATSVVSRNLAELTVKYDEAEKIAGGHDALIFRLNAALHGYFFADKNNYIQFRRHVDNASSASKSFLYKIKQELTTSDGSELETAKFFKKYYKSVLPETTLLEIDLLLNYNKNFKSKWSLLTNKKFRRENKLMNIIFIYRIFLSKF